MSKKPFYQLCPRCELNYYNSSQGVPYCDVCMAELRLKDPEILIPEEEDSELEILCPGCKVNYMSPDETMCFLCTKEITDKSKNAEESEDWSADEDALETQEEPLEISLSELEEEELKDEEEEDMDGNEDDFDDYPDDFDDYLDDEDDEDYLEEDDEDYILDKDY